MTNRTKIGTRFYQSGYGRGAMNANIYLIDGYAYARSKYSWNTDYTQLAGDLEGYVRVNAFKSGDNICFSQCNEAGSAYHPHRPFTLLAEVANA